MDYRTLGRAGVKVSPLCLGCMNFGGRTDEKETIRIVREALDAGINFIDTADVYSHGVSEQYVGKAISDRRDSVVLATKVNGKMGDGPNDAGNSRYHIIRGVEASLKRLKTDRIDLYQLHRPDYDTPIDEQLSALTDLVRQGKVLYIGTSTFPAWELCEALWTADRRQFERPVCEQPPYNIMMRGIERELLPLCRRHGMAVIPWSPLLGGWLAGKYRKGAQPPAGSRADYHKWSLETDESLRRLEIVEKLVPLAEKVGVTLSQFSLAWLLSDPVVTAPIIGPRTLDHLRDNLKSVDIKLDDEIRAQIDEIVPPGTNV